MKNLFKKDFFLYAIAVFIASTGTVLAASELKVYVRSVSDVLGIVDRFVNIMFTFLLIASVFFMFKAAWIYMSEGNKGSSGVEEAHKQVTYAAIAIGVALLSKGLVPVMRDIITGSPNG